MGLRIVYGRAGSGKSRYCLEKIKEEAAKGSAERCVLLVPEQYSFQAERDLSAMLGRGGILGPEVLTFRRLAYHIFNQEGGACRPRLEAVGKALIIHRLLEKHKKELEVFSSQSGLQGFINKVSELFTEFKRCGISPKDLSANLPKLQPGLLRSKIEDLIKIYIAYEETLAEEYLDPADDLTLARTKLGTSKMYENALIWVDGFTGFTPQEYDMLGELMLKAERLEVVLTTPELKRSPATDRAFRPPVETYERLRTLAVKIGVVNEEPLLLNPSILPRFAGSEELRHLEKNLYALRPEKYTAATTDISLHAARSIFAETEKVAQEIIELVRGGMTYRDIAVVVRDLEAYEMHIEALFAEYGIPYFIDRKENLVDRPLIRMIVSLFEIHNFNWSYESVFRYLKTGYSDLEAEEVDTLENYVLACNIRGSDWLREERWTYRGGLAFGEESTEEEEYLEEINRLRAIAAAPLINLFQKLKKESTAAGFAHRLFEFLNEQEIDKKTEEKIKRFKEDGDHVEATTVGQIWNNLLDLLDKTVLVAGDERMSFAAYAELLTAGLAEYRLGLLPPALDRVLVGSVERSRSHIVKALFIPGVNDGVFPMVSGGESILLDEERTELKELGLELVDDVASRLAFEEHLIYRALTTPTNLLKISWPLADGEGKELRPSLLISRLRKIFPALREEHDPLTDHLHGILPSLSPLPAFREMIAALFDEETTEDERGLWREVLAWFAESEEYAAHYRAFNELGGQTNTAARLDGNLVKGLYGKQIKTSVSRLELFNSCPFAFFMHYGLRAEERKVFRFRAPEIGSYLHLAMEIFSNKVEQSGLDWSELDSEWQEEKIVETVEEVITLTASSAIYAEKQFEYLKKGLTRILRRAIALSVIHFSRGRFRPCGYELNFALTDKDLGQESGEETEGSFTLNGIIDRADTYTEDERTYFRVIDYKSGRDRLRTEDIYHGLQLQLLTYLYALRRQAGGKEHLPAGAFYFRLADPYIRTDEPLDADEAEKQILSELKMNGLILAEQKIALAMDDLEEREYGVSGILPFGLKKPKKKDELPDFYKSTNLLSAAEFLLLEELVEKRLWQSVREIQSGIVDISPYRKRDQVACRYCPYESACQFDTRRRENRFRELVKLTDEEFWRELRRERGDGE